VNRWVGVLLAVIAIAATACGNGDGKADNDRFRGFYGGVSGGMTPPP
jgi:hypothetical protein